MVVFSAGIRPNVDLAQKSGVEVDRFILVNERMETSAKDVYACGDCASFEGKSWTLEPSH